MDEAQILAVTHHLPLLHSLQQLRDALDQVSPSLSIRYPQPQPWLRAGEKGQLRFQPGKALALKRQGAFQLRQRLLLIHLQQLPGGQIALRLVLAPLFPEQHRQIVGVVAALAHLVPQQLLPTLFRRVLQGASLLLLHPMGRQQQCANVLAAGAVTVFVPGTGTAGTDKGAVGPQPALRPAALPAAAHQSAEMPHPPAAGLFLQVPHLVFQLAGVGQDLLPQQIADLFSVHVPSPSRCVFKSSIG